MKKLLMIIVLSFAMQVGDARACEGQVSAKVNGLVCDFCATALEKVLGKHEAVDSLVVDLDKGSVNVKLHEGKSIDDETLTKLITDSGYEVVAINHPRCG
jgi:copper chaperone CopZ